MTLFCVWLFWYFALGFLLDQVFVSPDARIGYDPPPKYGSRFLARAIVVGFWPMIVIALAISLWIQPQARE